MLKLEYKNYQLDFKFEAGTSRGKLTNHKIWILKIVDDSSPSLEGFGEAAPLEGLSPDSYEEVGDKLGKVAKNIKAFGLPKDENQVFQIVNQLVGQDFPSLVFGLQTALLDLMNGGKKRIFYNDFYEEKINLKINGLIWMGEPAFMQSQIDEKLAAGFKCIKIKVGAIDFDEELKIIEYLRKKSPKVIIRLDANGGFANSEVLSKLSLLSQYDIHSIEQPIMPGQHEAMQLICEKSPIPVAFDEELINVKGKSAKLELLKYTKPAFLVFKPTLLGGIQETREWMELANMMQMKWWMTSALESNIGLNAISQFTSQFENPIHQGLGTGSLYQNNIKSPLMIHGEYLTYDAKYGWDIPSI
ncbi:MAG: O-succinylbenzoate synthase [Cyclobacteriaceae bacterium]|jgi:O-succinylbenzoate synthase